MVYKNKIVVLHYKIRTLQSIICFSFLFSNAICQWSNIPDYNFYCNTASLADSTKIWGAGRIGGIFSYNLRINQFQFYQFSEEYDILSIYPQDSSTIYLGGRNNAENRGFILLYDPSQDSIIFFKNQDNEIWDIEFINQDTGFIVGFEGIQKTKDGGQTWNVIWDFFSVGADFGEFYSIISITDSVLYACGRKQHQLEGSNHQGFILKSSDYGISWDIVLEIPDSYFMNLEYRHNKVYCHDKETNTILISNESGNTWDSIEIPINNPLVRINDVTMLGVNHILACVSQNIFFASNGQEYSIDMLIDTPDGGNTWYVQYENFPIYPPRDTLLNTLVNLNDAVVYSFGWNLALVTQNSGGDNNPILSLSSPLEEVRYVLYPNPATNTIYVEGNFNATNYTIQTLSGEVIRSNSINTKGVLAIPIYYLDPNAYIISFKVGSNISLSKLFIKM